jgi:hypothetical protein
MYNREQILAAMKTNLAGITKAAGYENTVKAVLRNYEQYDQVKEYPSICVIPAPSPVRHLDSFQTYESDLGYNIIVYVKVGGDPAKQNKLSTALESMIGDVIKRNYANYDLGLGTVVDESVIDNVEPYFDWEMGIGIGVIQGHVLYHTTFANP